jgi:cysteinyl-tRNA synthetase
MLSESSGRMLDTSHTNDRRWSMRAILAFSATAVLLAACGGPHARPGDAGPPDAAPTDAVPRDTAPSDTAPTDTAPSDAAPPDAPPNDTTTPDAAPADGGVPVSPSRGFPTAFPWVSFYGGAAGVDLARVASTFRIINIDVDPDTGNFTDDDIATLRAGGQNRVISYLDVGSCESFRSYFASSPPGFRSCQDSGALTTVYSTDYPDEMWADLSNPDYRDLIVGYVAARLAARGVDGFFLDNLEVVEHGAAATYGPCDASCAQGGLDLVYALRQAFPDHLIVMQNATSDVTRTGTTHGLPYPSLLDGVSHEEVYGPQGDAQARSEMLAWRDLGLPVNGRPFWLASEDYVGACAAASKATADGIYAMAMADGLNAYVTDDSGAQQGPCFWSDF